MKKEFANLLKEYTADVAEFNEKVASDIAADDKRENNPADYAVISFEGFMDYVTKGKVRSYAKLNPTLETIVAEE